MVITATHGKIYRHDTEGLASLQAEHPEIYAKVVKVKHAKVEVEQPKKKSKKASTK